MDSCIRKDTPLESALSRQKAFVAQSRPVRADLRIDRLRRLEAMIRKHQRSFVDAARIDFSERHPVQTRMELSATVDAAKHAARHLRDWMKPHRAKLPLVMRLTGGRGEVHFQPLGVVGVIAPWNFPFTLSLGPLAGIFAAGNSAMVKLSELAPACAEAVATAVGEFYPADELATVVGGIDLAQAFTALPFDHLLFTGSPQVAHHVMRSAADNLVPVTLELGGKCPVVVDRDADLALVARRVMFGKAQNAGQICLAPDTLFVPEDQVDGFIDEARKVITTWFPKVSDNPDYVAMIDQRAYDRMGGYVAEARAAGVRVEMLGSDEGLAQQEHRKFPPALIVDPADTLAVSREEIFGPLAVLRGYSSMDDVIAYLDARERPLALYYFGKNKTVARHLRDRTVSGGMTVNDIVLHAAVEDMPLGGIGNSGMGSYHGRAGFETFSHARSVYTQGRVSLLGFMTPPYTSRQEKMLDRMLGPMAGS